MKLKRTHTIKALLLIYIGLSAAVCIALPSHLSDGDNDPDAASISSAPLDLPQDIQQRIEEDLGAKDTSEPVTEPEPDETLPQTPEETEAEPQTPPETDQKPEAEAPPETDQKPEAEVPPETDQEPEAETPPETDQEPEAEAPSETETPAKHTAYISTEHAGASVNLRAAANSDAKIIASVCDKDEVTVLSVSGKWYEIQIGDVTGYIYQDYLVLADE